jgi:hypothetical protein
MAKSRAAAGSGKDEKKMESDYSFNALFTDINELKDISYTLKNTRVKYTEIKNKFCRAMISALNGNINLGNKFAVAIGVSLNLESLQGKDGRKFFVGTEEITYDDFLAIIKKANASSVEFSKRIETSKDSLTVGRIAKAFAADTIQYLTVFPDMCNFNKFGDSALAIKYKFPNSPYGMNDKILKENAVLLNSFFISFQKVITEAYENNFVKTSASGGKRDWPNEFISYLSFRKITIDELQ